MSWYKKNLQSSEQDQAPNNGSLKGSYIQVPSSSPIQVKPSPTKSTIDYKPPSRLQMSSPEIDAEKQRQLEAKRQAIRNHKDFPMVRKRFYYLEESDVFKGFVKGRGVLREITQWLTENYNKEDILGRKHAEEQKQLKLRAEERKRAEQEKLFQDLESRQETQRKIEAEETIEDEKRDFSENESPMKIVRGKARVKAPTDFTSETKNSTSFSSSSIRKTEGDSSSTNVSVTKPKVSILDKYKYKPKSQGTLAQSRLDGLFTKKAEPTLKKRRLVRASNLDDSNGTDSETSGTATPTSVPPSVPGYMDSIPKLKLKFPDLVDEELGLVALDELDEGIVEDDDLDRLEEKIRENRKMAKGKRSLQLEEDDDDLEDDIISDGMSEEEDDNMYNTGLTSIDSQILEFLNNASVQDLVEICQVTPSIAEIIVSKRPFPDIYTVSEDKFESEDSSADGGSKKKRYTRKTLGQKIIESTEFSLKGYRAVDSLIKKCSEYGDLITKQMETWGVTFTKGLGELEMVDIENPTDAVVEIKDNEDEDNEEDDDDDDEDIKIISTREKKLAYVAEKPTMLGEDVILKNYQQVGINWLNLLYQNKLSCILADEMGLGKTCQVIAFMALLKESSPSVGPHLVVVPSSTLENWLREFQKFCPGIKVQAYYGSQKEREELRYELQDEEYDVLVTTYTIATGGAADFKYLRHQPFDMIVYDEGHMLKNSSSDRYTKLMRLKARFRLLLTGTPLQNNLKELVSLLSFMLPGLFSDKREDLHGLFNQKASTNDSHKDYNPLLSQQAINKAKTMMTPFVLRRKKDQVLKHLPAKTHVVEYCKLTKPQKELYTEHLERARENRAERERRKLLPIKELAVLNRTDPMPTSTNVMMSLRKASMHPLLFRKQYDDEVITKMAKAIMEEPEYVEANQEYIREDMTIMSDYELNSLCKKFPKTLSSFQLDKSAWFESGKVQKTVEIVNKIIKEGNRVLIFSLFTQMLDILETVLSYEKIKFLRLDGSTTVETRQDIIDQFYDDETIPVFLLSTKAGGFGINLVVANNVIMYDQSFNPHDDRQAEDRAHRVGQEKEVKVTKLITEGTIEENVFQLAQNKLALDQSISADGSNEKQYEEKAASLFEKILFSDFQG